MFIKTNVSLHHGMCNKSVLIFLINREEVCMNAAL